MLLNNRYLVYQAYGSTDIFNELIYSVYSLIKVYSGKPPVQVIIYTDNSPLLKCWLPDWVQYRDLDQDIINDWSGPSGFVHRVKVKMILDCISERAGQFLYVDTDTYFRQEIDSLYQAIGSGQYVMHTREGVVSDRNSIIFRKIYRFLDKHPELGVSCDVVMYNAGVLGFSDSDAKVIQEVIELTDKMYEIFPKHIIEQLAFSHCMANHKTVIESQKIIHHYWNFKEFRTVLKDFFEFNKGHKFNLIVPKIDQINPEILHKPKLEYENLPFLLKAIRKTKKIRWVLPIYDLS